MEFLMSRYLCLSVSCAILSLLVFSTPVRAQLSPGELHSTHAFLEGVNNCNKCHSAKQEILADNCLNCHTSIKKSLADKSGLHGKNAYDNCVTCHVEHQGRNYDLVYWKDGRQKFDHTQTGFSLLGKHAKVECANCHKPDNIKNKETLIAEKRSLERTFFGLTQACADCHFDEHRGQLSQQCQNCHTNEGWKPVPGFDHSKAKFVLTGKHVAVACEKCHKEKADANSTTDPSFRQFVGIKSQACTDCHTDAHNGKFGLNCTGCHDTQSWRSTNRVNFDHNKTQFPLVGKHMGIACEKCHKPGQPFAGIKFDKCRQCHEDYHHGEFAKRASAGACEECHGVEGFRPAKFTLEQHQKSDYPLAGGHLAVPCEGCHRPNRDAKPAKEFQFAFKTTDCESCHGDPHKGSQKKLSDVKTCEGCHQVDSWQLVAFDHEKTKFPLVGKHATTACRKCHSAELNKFDPAQMRFVITNFTCSDCHQDKHGGQFALANATPPTDCARCHFSSTWKELKFDHNRDSAYKLEGAHSKVPCNGCHKEESTESAPVVRYKPIASDCKSCHDTDLLRSRKQP